MMMIVVFMCTLFRGNGVDPSIVGVTKCMAVDHLLLTILILSGIISTVIAAFWVRRDFVYKQKIGYKFE